MDNDCIYGYTNEEIIQEFPLSKCGTCPHRKILDDEEGLMICEKASGEVLNNT